MWCTNFDGGGDRGDADDDDDYYTNDDDNDDGDGEDMKSTYTTLCRDTTDCRTDSYSHFARNHLHSEKLAAVLAFSAADSSAASPPHACPCAG